MTPRTAGDIALASRAGRDPYVVLRPVTDLALFYRNRVTLAVAPRNGGDIALVCRISEFHQWLRPGTDLALVSMTKGHLAQVSSAEGGLALVSRTGRDLVGVSWAGAGLIFVSDPNRICRVSASEDSKLTRNVKRKARWPLCNVNRWILQADVLLGDRAGGWETMTLHNRACRY